MKGTVKFFDARRGWGFIAGEDEKDYYVHFSDIQMDGFRTLRRNADVEFEPASDEQGRISAKDVKAI